MAQSTSHLICNGRQLAALAAAARQEIVDVLEQMGTVSVAELAAALGRPADSLYFHLRTLTRVGLVQSAGYRARPGGKEALYRTAAPELRVQYKPRDSANRKAVSAIAASMLRLAIRDFRRSFERGHVLVSGAHRELWSLRKVGRLSRAQLAQLNRNIKGLTQNVSSPRGRGRLYGVTVVLTPLEHRNKLGAVAKSKRRGTQRREKQ
jgi:DNA-binding transcriptional ArsR family regulator